MIPPRWTVGIAVGRGVRGFPTTRHVPAISIARERLHTQAAAVARGEKIASGFGGDQGFSHGADGYPAYMTEAVLRLSLRCDRTAPRRTREALDLIDGITSIREDAKLVATELITDAIMRSEGTSNELIKVTATLRRDQLTISVHRPRDSDQAPQFRPNDLEQRRLGLLIVDRIARRWGTEHADGRVVWAELTAASEKLDPSPHSAPSS